MKRLTQQEFIEKARLVHNDKYDYSKVEYKNNRTKICIICPEHGEFWQLPASHLRGIGCNKCGGTGKLTTAEFIEKAKQVHGDKYDYSKTEYIDSHTKVSIICPEHGEFFQTPNNHLNGNACPKCSRPNFGIGTKEWIEKAKQVHGDDYDYSKTIYVDSTTKVCIICPEHGEFWQRPVDHLHNQGCPGRRIKKHWDTRGRLTSQEWIEKAKQVHGEKYDYSKVEYKNTRTKVCIICPKHGEFWQTSHDHLQGRGCPQCRGSQLETEITALLDSNNISYVREQTFEWLKYKGHYLYLDFYIPTKNIAIECQGIQHYMPLRYSMMTQDEADILYELRLLRDAAKRDLCRTNNVNLLYYTNKNIFEKWANDKKNLYYNKQEILKIINNG